MFIRIKKIKGKEYAYLVKNTWKKRKKSSRQTSSSYLGKVIKLKKTNNKSLLGEFWDFLKIRKAWWLVPIIIMLFLVGLLIVFGQSSALSPFIYALF